jgi:carboxyl-terminal processing protease
MMLKQVILCVVLACGGVALAANTTNVSASRDDETQIDYELEIATALDQLEERCGRFFDLKDIDWKKVRKEFGKRAKSIETDGELSATLLELLAHVKDGHAAVVPLQEGATLPWPDDYWTEKVGPGFFLCRIGKGVYIKNSWSGSAELGIEPGMQVLKINGVAAPKWLDARREECSVRNSFSTAAQADFYACHWGLAEPPGTRWKLELKGVDKKKSKRTVTFEKASVVAEGPAFPPQPLKWDGQSLGFGFTTAGWGYIHLRRIKGTVLDELDQALGKMRDAPGLILDFRGNSGGGVDHDAFESRFIPVGKEMPRMARPPLSGAGPHGYGGPVIVIIDATVRSAGETVAGMFKEDGRAYMIGESPTAGMSAQKETIELPSGRYGLYVAVASNRGSFNDGRGIEGIGVPPNEVVQYDPEDLNAGRDTLILRAEALLAKYPQKEVRYDPEGYGWVPGE